MPQRRRLSSFASVSSEDSGDCGDADERLQSRLSAGKRALRRIRCRVGVSMISLGIILGIGYDVLLYMRLGRLKGRDVCEAPAAYDHLEMICLEFCFYGRLLGFSLAPLADALWFLRFMLGMDAFVIISGAVMGVMWISHQPKERTGADRFPDLFQASSIGKVWLCNQAVFVLSIVRAMCTKGAKQMQDRMWLSIACFECLSLAYSLMRCLPEAIICRTFMPPWWGLPCEIAVLVFALKTTCRQSVQAKLIQFSERHTSARAAAGIAALVGNFSVEEAYSEASRRFRSIRLTDLSYEDLANNAPNPDLFLRSSPTTLHECDAFISHSWHDDARAKWGAIQRWRTDFIAREGREPTLWFDKCCIDQSNIDADLRCLPIFLSGCRSLVVFAGPTYLSRLWCVMELFTFAHMQRATRDIEVYYVSDVYTQRHLDRIGETFAAFDAGKCQCHLLEDKARLLQIICTAFGSLGAFNQAAKKIFHKVGLVREFSGELNLSDTDSSPSEDSQAS